MSADLCLWAKTHKSISKKKRGQVLRWLAENEPEVEFDVYGPDKNDPRHEGYVFRGPNYGSPHDDRLRKRVREGLKAAGINL